MGGVWRRGDLEFYQISLSIITSSSQKRTESKISTSHSEPTIDVLPVELENEGYEAAWGRQTREAIRSPMRCKPMKSRAKYGISLDSGGAERAEKSWVHQKILFLASAFISERFRSDLDPPRRYTNFVYSRM